MAVVFGTGGREYPEKKMKLKQTRIYYQCIFIQDRVKALRYISNYLVVLVRYLASVHMVQYFTFLNPEVNSYI